MLVFLSDEYHLSNSYRDVYPSAQEIHYTTGGYCGLDWMDAYDRCPLVCPSGRDEDCDELGEGYSCHEWTGCESRVSPQEQEDPEEVR